MVIAFFPNGMTMTDLSSFLTGSDFKLWHEDFEKLISRKETLLQDSNIKKNTLCN